MFSPRISQAPGLLPLRTSAFLTQNMTTSTFDLTRPRWRKVIADLWESRTRTFLVVASIAVGVFAIGTILNAYVIIGEDLSVSYSAANPANIQITTDPFDDNFIRTIEKVDGVAAVEGRHALNLRISKDGGDTWGTLQVLAVDDFTEANIFHLDTLEGTNQPSERELILETNSVSNLDISLGTTLWVELDDGTVRQMPVVGVVKDQAIIGGPDSTSVGYVSMDTLTWLGRGNFFNRLYVTVDGDVNDTAYITAVADDIEAKIEKENRTLYDTSTSGANEHPMTNTVLAVLSVLVALGALMLVLGSSLIANTLNALLAQHKRQIGVMKLVGAQSRQIIGMYVLLIIAYSLIALLVAIPLSMASGYRFSEYMANELSITLQGARIVWPVIFFQIGVAIVIPLVAGFLPVNSGSRTTVEKAISDDQAEAKTNSGFFDRLGEQAEWMPRPLLISLRNTFRRKARLALTLFTLTMAGAIFIAVFNVQASLFGFIEDIEKLFLADVLIDFSEPYRVEAVHEALSGIPGIVNEEGWLFGNGEILDSDNSVESSVILIAPPLDSIFIEPKVHTGRWQTDGDFNTIVVSDAILEKRPDIQPGDTIEMKMNGRRAETWTVIGFFTFPDPAEDALFGYAPYDAIEEELNLPDQVMAYRLETAVHTLEFQQKTAKMVDDRLRALGFNVTSVDAGQATIQEVSEAMNILVSFLLIMAVLTAVVGSIGLAGTMGMNVLERTREIGVMRAIGAVDTAIMKSVIFEGMFIGIISWLIGVVLSIPISFILLRLISTSLFSTPLDLDFSPRGFIIWLFVVLILAAVASILPARNAARLTIREVLAYE